MNNALPDPLICFNGSRVTSRATWERRRRPELLRLLEREMFGRTLLQRPRKLRFELREQKNDAREGRATRLRVGILFEGRTEDRQLELLVYLPNQNPKARVPLFLGLNFDGNYTTTAEPDLPLPTHYVMGLFQNRPPDHRAYESARGIHASMFPYDKILEQGYGVATACYGEVEPDYGGAWRVGPRGLAKQPGAEDWGAIGAWAWSLSRCADYLTTHPRIDASRLGLFGFSRLGKTAMWAAAQDTRFKLIVSQESGKGGISLMRRRIGEPVAHLTGTALGHWFAPKFATYGDRELALPIDGHLLGALIAPRPLLILSGTEDSWSDPEGEFLGGQGADSVYRLLGTDGLKGASWPKTQTLVGGTIGYYLRPGKHDVTAEDWEATLRFAALHWK